MKLICPQCKGDLDLKIECGTGPYFNICPRRFNAKHLYLVPIIGDGLRERFPIGMDKDREVRELNTFDIYSPTFVSHHYLDEVYSWFKEEGFKEIEPTRYILGMKGVKF